MLVLPPQVNWTCTDPEILPGRGRFTQSSLALYLRAHNNLGFLGNKKGLWTEAWTVQLPILSL